MADKPLRSILLEQISDLEHQKSALMGSANSRASTSNLISQADLDYQIKITQLQSVIAQSQSASEILEYFIEDGGRIEFVDPNGSGYPIRGQLYFDTSEHTPVITLTPDERSNHDMALAVSECLKAYDENVLDYMNVFESYDSDIEEMLMYENEDKFQETEHPVYKQAKTFGQRVTGEIAAYEKMCSTLTDYKCEKNTLTANPAPEFVTLGSKITFNPN